MKTWFAIPVLSAVVFAFAAPADAAYCGADGYRHCKARSACCDAPSCCTVTKTCQEVVYEEKQFTEYESKFKEVEETKVIDVVKFVEDKEEREICVTVWETRPSCCGKVDCCGSCCCTKQVPVQCMRKVMVPVIREVPAKETIKFTRIVEEKIAKTFTCKVPKVTCCEVQVPVCCPTPCCGK